MIKKNIHQESIIQEKGCHGGKGAVLFRRILQEEFESAISFLDYTIIPAGATIGFHPHQDSEEVYIVLKGEGLMRVDNEEQRVVEGDVILNKSGSSHGLVNDGTSDMAIFVVEGTLET